MLHTLLTIVLKNISLILFLSHWFWCYACGFKLNNTRDNNNDVDVICKISDGSYRGTKLIDLKEIADDAIAKCKDKWVSSLFPLIIVQSF